MKKIVKVCFIMVFIFFGAYAVDTTKTIVPLKADTLRIPTAVKPKPATNWSRVKDLFL